MTVPVTSMRTCAVILAAGSGTRSGLDYPKQFLRLGGLTVLEHTLLTFQHEPWIDDIVIVGAEGWLETTRDVAIASGADKVSAIIPGGTTRNESTRAAIDHLTERLDGGDCKLLLHDAVRPLVSGEILRGCVAALDEYSALDVVIETADTIVTVDDGQVTGIPRRANLRRGQTPQGFHLSVLRSAYDQTPPERLLQFTDDCAVVKAAMPELPIVALTGSEENIKITRPLDIYLADRLLQGRQISLDGTGDTEALKLSGCAVVIGGGSGIGKSIVDRLSAAGLAVETCSRGSGVDVRDPAGLRDCLERTRGALGPIAAVINTAGVLEVGELLEADDATVADQIDINLKGAINVARAAYPYLSETRGHLLLFTSSSYTRGRAGYACYSASKAGVVNVTQALAEEWQHSGVKVNCVNPARTATPMRTRAFGDEPPQSLLQPERVANAALGVLTREMTGHVFDVRL